MMLKYVIPLFLVLLIFIFVQRLTPKKIPLNIKYSNIKGESIEVSPIGPTAVVTPVVTATFAPVLTRKTSRTAYKLALYGDSMIDTMGDLKVFGAALAKVYPNTKFTLYNYGIGAQNVEQGLARFDTPFNHNGRTYPPISQINADIIILGSFAYNPFTPHDKNRHFSLLRELTQKAVNTAPAVYILAEIAPLRQGFGHGPKGVNWDTDTATAHSASIIEQLEGAVYLARELNVSLVNVYKESGGALQYISSDDGIHPSGAGHELTAVMLVKALDFDD